MIPTSMAISGIAGMALSIMMTYIPGLNVAWARLSTEAKQGIMAVLIICSGVGATLYTYNGEFTPISWKALVSSIFAALVTNQPTKMITPEPAAVKAVKAEVKAQEAAVVASENVPLIDRQSFMKP